MGAVSTRRVPSNAAETSTPTVNASRVSAGTRCPPTPQSLRSVQSASWWRRRCPLCRARTVPTPLQTSRVCSTIISTASTTSWNPRLKTQEEGRSRWHTTCLSTMVLIGTGGLRRRLTSTRAMDPKSTVRTTTATSTMALPPSSTCPGFTRTTTTSNYTPSASSVLAATAEDMAVPTAEDTTTNPGTGDTTGLIVASTVVGGSQRPKYQGTRYFKVTV